MRRPGLGGSWFCMMPAMGSHKQESVTKPYFPRMWFSCALRLEDSSLTPHSHQKYFLTHQLKQVSLLWAPVLTSSCSCHCAHYLLMRINGLCVFLLYQKVNTICRETVIESRSGADCLCASVALGNSFNVSKPQLPCLQNENNSTYCMGLLSQLHNMCDSWNWQRK